jgi:DNA-binding phage protein
MINAWEIGEFKEFKTVPGFPMYKISPWGVVIRFKGGRWVPIKSTINSDGNYRVSLSSRGIPTVKPIASLVLESHVEASPENHVARYRNGNSRDISLKNLYWGPAKEISPENNRPWRKLSARDVETIKHMIRSGDRDADIASRFGVSRQNISKIRSGKGWPHIKAKEPVDG